MIASQLEEQLEKLPDIVADSLVVWREITLQREKMEALLYLSVKAQSPDDSATQIKAKINSSDERFQAVLKEIKAEGNYKRLEERLLCAKKLASLRTAF